MQGTPNCGRGPRLSRFSRRLQAVLRCEAGSKATPPGRVPLSYPPASLTRPARPQPHPAAASTPRPACPPPPGPPARCPAASPPAHPRRAGPGTSTARGGRRRAAGGGTQHSGRCLSHANTSLPSSIPLTVAFASLLPPAPGAPIPRVGQGHAGAMERENPQGTLPQPLAECAELAGRASSAARGAPTSGTILERPMPNV